MCLVFAVYHSPLLFIRTLLEIGADPNVPVDDGFPPLIAALSCTREVRGAARRTDVEEIVRLLLSFGADVHQRGINDFTPLHMAVASATLLPFSCSSNTVPIPSCGLASMSIETPLEMAEAAGWAEGAALLRRGRNDASRSIHKALDTKHRLSD